MLPSKNYLYYIGLDVATPIPSYGNLPVNNSTQNFTVEVQ